VFLKRVGQTVRQATSDIAKEDLAEEIVHLLRRLERIEQRDNAGIFERLTGASSSPVTSIR
jgi:hypothetical protein